MVAVMTLTNWVEVTAFASCLTIHVIAARLHFVSPQGVPVRSKLIGVLFFLFGAVNVWTLSRMPLEALPAIGSLLLYAGAIWLFLAARCANRSRPLTIAFTTDRPDHLVTTGPYRYIRHPFYASYCLTWAAAAVVSGSALLLLIFACMTTIYWQAALFEEEKFLHSSLSADYTEYRANTGMFIPLVKMSRSRSNGKRLQRSIR
jgi:protein-S-isoprenylcysteine O-methyltransferase Ste14